jgi:hypothetical protein
MVNSAPMLRWDWLSRTSPSSPGATATPPRAHAWLLLASLALPFAAFACGGDGDAGLGAGTTTGPGAGGSAAAGDAGAAGDADAAAGSGGDAGATGEAGASAGGAGGEAAAGAPGQAGASGEAGEAGEAGAPGEAGSGGDAGSAGGVPELEPIDPIAVGRTWTYDVTTLGVYPTCPGGSHTAKATGSSTIAGKTAVTVTSLCAFAGSYDYATDGDRVYSYVAGKWRLSLDAPVEEGHTWSDDFADYVWNAADDQTVGGVVYPNCWTARRDAKYDSFTVFCRGVGPVRWHYEDGFGNGYDATLTAFTP